MRNPMLPLSPIAKDGSLQHKPTLAPACLDPCPRPFSDLRSIRSRVFPSTGQAAPHEAAIRASCNDSSNDDAGLRAVVHVLDRITPIGTARRASSRCRDLRTICRA